MSGFQNEKAIYLMGIGGIGMVNVAAIMREAGFVVSGSDEGVYEPAATLLRKLGIEFRTPYSPANLPQDNTPLIVGNAQSRGHVEVEAALNQSAPMYSFPDFLVRHAITDRHRIVVAGTHGKSTTTTLVAHLLTACGLDPGFLIGALPVNLICGGKLGSPSYFVIEGDEYDSAFFDKRSKFLHYFPRTLVLGPVEFDHADIFANLDEVLLSFQRLIRLLPANGLLVYDADSENTCALAAAAPCQKVGVGSAGNAGWRLARSTTSLEFSNPDGSHFTWSFQLPGFHNRKNALMAIAAVRTLLGHHSVMESSVASFRGLKRRMEKLSANATLTVYDDFAHHPTAIAASLDAVRESHPTARVIAVLEPRSNTMVRDIFQSELPRALSRANEVIIGDIHRAETIPPDQRLNYDQISRELDISGIPLTHVSNAEAPEYLARRLNTSPTVVIFMSNGSFSGVPHRFVELVASAPKIAMGLTT